MKQAWVIIKYYPDDEPDFELVFDEPSKYMWHSVVPIVYDILYEPSRKDLLDAAKSRNS